MKKTRTGLPAEAENYIEGLGARKTASARVRIVASVKPGFLINGKAVDQYFQDKEDRIICQEPLAKVEGKHFKVSVKVAGGGTRSQAEAVRHGLGRALVGYDPELRHTLKVYGYLKRDPRMRERKKFGLVRARRARQWRKR